MSGTEKMIMIMLVGVMFSGFILFAGSRSMFIDQMAVNWGVEVWEIAYTTYFISFIIAVAHNMVTDKTRFSQHTFPDIIIVTMLAVISYFMLNVMSVGGISVAVTSMINENLEWSFMYALVLAVYMTSKMVKR
jgi:hypothetical protein